MRYMLDADACLALIRHRPASVLRRLEGLAPGDVGLSTLTLAELRREVAAGANVERNAVALEDFLLPLEIADFGQDAAAAYGRLRAGLDQAETPFDPLDAQIVAHALSLNAVLVTGSAREFRRVPGLKVEDWLGPRPQPRPRPRSPREEPPPPDELNVELL